MKHNKIYRYGLFLTVAVALFSCKKDGSSKSEKYVVSASKMIGLTANNWDIVRPMLQDYAGFKYEEASPNASSMVKGEVHLPAIDDSSRIESGTVYLNVTPDNLIHFASYDIDSLNKSTAYALMLNYNNATLKTLTGIASSRGFYQENNIGGPATVDDILSKLKNGQPGQQLSIIYQLGGRGTTFTIVVFRQNDGRYQFSYRGN